jgi:hypothetical protein
LIPARQVSGKWLMVLSVVALIISLVFVGFAYQVLAPANNGVLFGTLFVNEGGYSNATSTETGSYNVTLTAQKGTGSLLLTFLSGDDLVQDHLLSFSNYSINTNQVTMVISGHMLTLPWEDNDTVWNHQFDNNYIASWGPSAPAYEVRGQVTTSVFGLAPADYIELRFAAQGGNPVQDF